MHDWNDTSTWAILLVDDEIDNLEVVAETLQFFGARVKTADNGMAGLELLKTFSPTLIVIDLSMPGMDGWHLRMKIKGLPDVQDVPIIALTAHAMIGDRERALTAGFDGYLTKPIDVHTLIADLRAALKNHELKSAVSQAKPVMPSENSAPSASVAESKPQIAPQEQKSGGTPPTSGSTSSSCISATGSEPTKNDLRAAQAHGIEAVVSMRMSASTEKSSHE